MKKGMNIGLIIVMLICFFAPLLPVSADETRPFELYIENANGTNLVESYASYNEAYHVALAKEAEDINNNLIIYNNGTIRYATYAAVNFKTKANSGLNTNYTIEYNGKNGYTNGYYGADAAFLGTNEDGSRIRFMQAGVIGWVNASEVSIISINETSYATTFLSNYFAKKLSDGTTEFRHVIVTDVYRNDIGVTTLGQEIPIGVTPSTGFIYYLSYDGHYFYNESLEGYRAMMRDYKNGVRTSSVNPNNPYYNYYQFLSHRSISNYTSDQLRQDFSGYISKVTITEPEVPKNQSQLFGEETSFIQYQNEFGANAIMMLGVAKNESNSGRSNIAINTNNLFGHGAFDSAPGVSANRYISVAQGIYAHAKYFISEGYLDVNDFQGRYYGGYVGDKSSGMNVKYASDPYWGEKAAANYYSFDKKYGLQDYGKYGIGIKMGSNSIPIKASPNNNSVTLYESGPITNYAVTILSSVIGENINGNNVWYKIQTDPVLNSNRTGMIQDSGYYDYNHNIGYIHSSYLNFVRNGQKEKNRYTISFNPNGGAFSDGITSTKKLTVEEYAFPDINPPSKDGYRFVGWDKEIVGATENMAYTAVWEVKQYYDITFDADGGVFNDGSTSKVIKVAQDQIPSFTMVPTKAGYVFTGWNKEIVSATENATYKAVYRKVETYLITFDANGGTFPDHTSSKTLSVEKGKKPDFTLEPTKEGYLFVGWDKEITVASKHTVYKAVYEEIINIEDLLKEEDGILFLDSIYVDNGKLHIKGFQTIESIDNNLNTPIQYMLVLVDIDQPEEKVYVDFMTRITDPSKIPYPSYGLGGKDYSYAWFEYETDFEGLADGNYIAAIMAFTNQEYSMSILNNLMFAPQVTSYSGAKEVLIRNVYTYDEQPVEFIVRSNKLADRTTKTYTYNQFDQVLELNFTQNNQLHIGGYTYSYGMDLNESAIVSRKIIFENQETYQTTSYPIAAVKGMYEPVLPVSDNLSKALAWYNANLDLSKLSKGTYTIYLATSSNISDISELTDLFNQNFSDVKTVINGKTYQFKTNLEKGNIVELIVS